LVNVFIFNAITGGKCAPEGKSEPSCKCNAIDLEMKIRMVHRYECGQILFAISCVLGFMVSTVNTIVKDAAHMKEHVKGIAPVKLAIIIIIRNVIVHEMRLKKC
jgi:hypothetical protein